MWLAPEELKTEANSHEPQLMLGLLAHQDASIWWQLRITHDYKMIIILMGL